MADVSLVFSECDATITQHTFFIAERSIERAQQLLMLRTGAKKQRLENFGIENLENDGCEKACPLRLITE
jgi:hypothetical protein